MGIAIAHRRHDFPEGPPDLDDLVSAVFAHGITHSSTQGLNHLEFNSVGIYIDESEITPFRDGVCFDPPPGIFPFPPMDWNRVEGNWKQITGKVKEKWGKLTDDDLAVINGNREQLEGKIQERYGLAKDQVKQDIDDWYRNQSW